MNLAALGLPEKQARVLEELLLRGPQTVRELSRRLGEQRTNCYLLLDKLAAQELVECDATRPIIVYRAGHPKQLRQSIMQRQEELRGVSTRLTKVMPELTSLYRLTTQRQGVAYFQSLKGYTAVLDDMANSQTNILVLASDTVIQKQPDVYRLLKQKVANRKANTQLIFSSVVKRPNIEALRANGVDVRLHPELPLLDSEIAIYDNSVALTGYDKSLTTIVINDMSFARSFRSIFQALWLTSSK